MRAERRIDGSAASGASAGSGLGTVPLFKRLLREHRRTFLTAGLGIVMLQLIRLARTSLFPLWGDAIGLDVSTVGLVVGIISGTELLFFYPAGHFMDRFGRKSTAIPCIILFSLSLFLLPLTTTFTGFLLVAVLNGFGNGLGSGINMTLSTDFAPRETPGEFIGIWRTIVDAGSVAGPIVVGTIGSIFGLAAAPVVLGSIGVCGAGLLGIARIPHPKRHVYHSRTATESAGSVNSPR